MKMTDKMKVRRENLRLVIASESEGKSNRFAEIVGTKASYLSQILSKNPIRTVSDDMASDIENRFGLPTGWMDTPHPLSDLSKPQDGVPILGVDIEGPSSYWRKKKERITRADQVIDVRSNDTISYALLCTGDYDFIGARSGSALLIEPSVTVLTGDDVFVRDNEGKTLVGRVGGITESLLVFSECSEPSVRKIEKSDLDLLHWIAGVMSARTVHKKVESIDKVRRLIK